MASALLSPALVHAETEIQWWHSMTGALSDQLNDIASQFNASQSEFKVVPVYKGGYAESMSAAIAAYRAKSPPHIAQVFEVGTATMMAARQAIKPVYQVMAESGETFDPKSYMPAVTSYYTDTAGRMLSMPFNSSTTVFYYNKDAFRKAGLNPDQPPKTWAEVGEAAKRIKDTNTLPCGYTTAWQSWVQLENASAWHNVAFATKDNGFGGMDARLVFNNPLLVRHIGMLGDWAKDGRFTYAGRTTQPEAKFYSGECAMITTSSAAYGNIKRSSKFEFAISALPYHADVKGAPQNSIIGGASLWVYAGRPKDEYRGVAKFFTFMSSAKIQAAWHQATGYVPITTAAYDLSKAQGFYDKNPGTNVAIEQLLLKNPTKMSKGVRLGNLVQIRDIIDEELEAVWSGKKTAKAALDEAVKRGDEELRKFERANKGAAK
ncbi:MAG: sn-glycerol-3-phosphate ABC transporter substrate-binding protein UgpB [Rhodoferax sp.]|uniref:sn-glycerol-3-phosphate ABC transporter substrate-binding protein UgpB n=1 Tax=Rhodoferax sp. TaxID=50421 RepID=UPI002635F236|nr:sn-glycerol-3-phosphate ABC transporter substrate-binding protein UgpB [Rhodoferax sp.]MDD5332658.1 sn-glycerol-3-phosphate ABC transporter substrate-binding protein UgpB [Rhodoferax sp.]